MPGTLDFVLGLQINKFLEHIGMSEVAIIGLEKAGEALKWSFEETWKVIEQGAALEALSKRTSESVGNLYSLQQAFKYCDVSSDGLANTIFMMQRALGGVSETGEDTSSTFAKLGLSISDLKSKGAAGALKDIVGALSKLDPESAAKAASMIFGRGGAADIATLSRNTKEFEEELGKAAAKAALFQANATAFEHAEKSVQRLKEKTTEFFLGVAAQVAPSITEISNALNNIDLSQLGVKFGIVIGGLAQAFKEGKLFSILGDGFSAVFESLPGLLNAATDKMGLIMTEFFHKQVAEAVGTTQWLQDKFKAGLSIAFGGPGGVGVGLARASTGPSLQDYIGDAETVMKLGSGLAQSDANAGLFDAGKKLQARLGKVYDTLSGLAANRATAANAGEETAPGTGTFDLAAAKGPAHVNVDSNAFQKMGFIMGGGTAEITQKIADNTKRTADLLDQYLRNAAGNLQTGPDSYGINVA